MKQTANLKLALAGAALAALPSYAAVPEVTDVQMSQNEASRRVKITYALSGPAVVTLDVQTNATVNGETVWASIGGAAVGAATGDVWKRVEAGPRTIRWQPDTAWPGHAVADGGARAVVTAWALDNTPDYLVVDVSAGAKPNTQRYYPSAEFLPGGLLGNDDYRTTSLVLRKVMAKDVTWTMGSTTLEGWRNAAREATHKATLTNNYYFGVFPVTQAQWALIQTDRPTPSWFNNTADRAMRPVEQVCYNEIRCAANSTVADTSCYYPADPHTDSFLGLLRTKTGLDFDLPSEAQWEFAARAGNGDTKWGDGSGILNALADENMNRLGRYQGNGGQVLSGESYADPARDCGAERATAIVGSYAPNDWGIYDTAGNVWELCLDWVEDDITAFGGKVNIDPANPANTLSGKAGENRVRRGGSWREFVGLARPAYRGGWVPSTIQSGPGGSYIVGFRVVCTAGLH